MSVVVVGRWFEAGMFNFAGTSSASVAWLAVPSQQQSLQVEPLIGPTVAR